MKRWLVVSTVSLLSTGALGLAAWTTAFAGTSQSASPSPTQVISQQEGSNTGANVQVGNQAGPDTSGKGTEQEASSSQDTGPNVQQNVQVGSQSTGSDSGNSSDTSDQ